jgi:hypothetical protein
MLDGVGAAVAKLAAPGITLGARIRKAMAAFSQILLSLATSAANRWGRRHNLIRLKYNAKIGKDAE